MPPDPTAPPAHLDATSKALYRKVRAFLREQGTWRDTDRELLVIYVEGLSQARAATLLVARDGQVVEGAKGPAAHPAIAVARGALRDATDAAKELLLTPRARKQYELEVAKGASSPIGDAFGA